MKTSAKNMVPWKVLDNKNILTAEPWLSVSVQRLKLHNGKVVDNYYQIHLPEYVIIVACTTEEKIIFLRQYRHGIGQVSILLPGGLIEKGENPLETAKRELREETGYASENWQSLGSYIPHSNYGCGKSHFFLTTHAKPVTQPMSGDLEEMEMVLLDEHEIKKAITNGSIASMSSVAAVSLALNPECFPQTSKKCSQASK